MSGKDTYIAASATIHDRVTIGKGCRIEDGARIYEDCIIGEGSIIGANTVLRPRTTVGDHSIVGTLTATEGDCSVGSYTTVHAQCHLTKYLSIGDNCFIGPMFMATNTPDITTGRHGTHKVDFKALPTIIENGVRIGANVRLTPGNRIGAFALIDQDTLVTKDVPPYAHVRGNQKDGKGSVGVIIGYVSH